MSAIMKPVTAVLFLLLMAAIITVISIAYGQSEHCQQTVLSNGDFPGEWSADCPSAERTGSYAHYYIINLATDAQITVTLTHGSGDGDPYLYIWEGATRSGTFVIQDDDGGGLPNSRVEDVELTAGTYAIEATTYGPGQTGTFTLNVSGLPDATTPGPDPTEPSPTQPGPTGPGVSQPGDRLSISTGDDHVCVLRSDGSVDCQAVYTVGRTAPSPDDRFTLIESGDDHTCGLREDGSVVCWSNPGGWPIVVDPTDTAGVGGRDNPIPFGSPSVVRNSDTDHWEITVLGVNPFANWEVRNQEPSSYDPPAEGNRYFGVRARVKYLGPGSARWEVSRLQAQGDEGVVYGSSHSCGVVPFAFGAPELSTGEQVEGNVCWEISDRHQSTLRMFLDPASSFEGSRTWFSLDNSGWYAYSRDNVDGWSQFSISVNWYYTGETQDEANLEAACGVRGASDPRLNVQLNFWQDSVSTLDAHSVRLTWDGITREPYSWHVVGERGSLVRLSEPEHRDRFIQMLKDHKLLKFEVQGDSGWHTATFDLTGFSTAYRPVEAFCGGR